MFQPHDTPLIRALKWATAIVLFALMLSVGFRWIVPLMPTHFPGK